MGSRLAEISCVADVQAILGEGPVWVVQERALYWVDINGRKIFRLRNGEAQSWETPIKVGSLAPRRQGGFVAGTDQGLAFVDLEEERFDVFANPEEDLPDNRFNDGKVDRSGRFWAGTMDSHERKALGSLYRLDPGLELAVIDTGYHVTNGPAFSPDGRTMYENDSARQVTYAFDLDAAGNAAGRRVFRQHGKGEGYPDGMTVDADGCLWIAFWDGWCVRRYAPDGELLQTVEVPVQRPTACAFGGENLTTLFVTSARRGIEGTDLDNQPLAGGLFAADVGVQGIAELPFAG
jgi:sugar lactone lactonase YvrE